MFNPNFITKLATTAVIGATTILGAVEPAKATQCFDGGSYTMCFEQTGRSGRLNRWTIQVSNQYTTETMDVICDGKFVHDWSSYGGASQAEARQLAASFCSL